MQYLYICSFIFLVVASLIEVTKIQASRTVQFIGFFLFSILLASVVYATRGAVDHSVYESMYNRLILEVPHNWTIDSFPEFGYQWVNYIFGNILGFDFNAFRSLYAFLSLLMMFFFSKYLTNKKFIFAMLYYPKYYITGLISHIRSSFIYPFIFIFIQLVQKKKYISFFTLTIALSQFHMSALLFNLLPFLTMIKGRAVYALCTIPFAVFCYYVLAPSLADLFFSLNLRQAGYFNDDSIGERTFFGVEMLKRFSVCLIIYYLYKFDKIESSKEDLVCKIILAGIFIYYMFFDARFISDRVPAIFSFIEPLVFIYLYEKSNGDLNKKIALTIVFLYAITDFASRFFLSDSFPKHISLF